MGREETKEPRPFGQEREQGPKIARQPPIERTVADAFERMQEPQGDHLTGPEVGLGMFGDGAYLLIDFIEQRRDKLQGHHRCRTLFPRSAAALPAHSAGADGPSRASYLRVSLVAISPRTSRDLLVCHGVQCPWLPPLPKLLPCAKWRAKDGEVAPWLQSLSKVSEVRPRPAPSASLEMMRLSQSERCHAPRAALPPATAPAPYRQPWQAPSRSRGGLACVLLLPQGNGRASRMSGTARPCPGRRGMRPSGEESSRGNRCAGNDCPDRQR
jgi:hypothetical protein